MTNTVIALKKSSTPSAQPTSLANGELAINFADGKLFYKNTAGYIAEISSGGNSFGTVNANSTLIVADSISDVLTIEAGAGITIVGDAINDKIIIGAIADQDVAIAAFDKANAANLLAFNTGIGANNWANTKVSSVTGTAGEIYSSGGTTPTINLISTGISTATYGNATIVPVFTVDQFGRITAVSNVSITGANGYVSVTTAQIKDLTTENSVVTDVSPFSGTIVDSAIASAAFNKANSANLLAFNTGIGANAFTSATIAGANTAVGTGANAFTSATVAGANTAVGTGANAFASATIAGANTITIAAFDKANAALPNTSGVSFSGYLSFPKGNVGVGVSNAASKVTISENAAAPQTPLTGTVLHVAGADSQTTRILLDTYGVSAPSITFRRAYGTASAPSTTGIGNTLGQILTFGYGATGYSTVSRASIISAAEEVWSDTAQGTRWTFTTTAAGTTTNSEKMRITSNGDIGIGTTTPVSKLDVSGNVNVTSALVVAGMNVVPTISSSYDAANSALAAAVALAIALG